MRIVYFFLGPVPGYSIPLGKYEPNGDQFSNKIEPFGPFDIYISTFGLP